VASTATIKSADVQVHKLFLRTVNIFPPHGLHVRDNFFSLQREPSDEHPGRVYIGVCATGRRLKAVLIPGLHRLPLLGPGALGEVPGPLLSLLSFFHARPPVRLSGRSQTQGQVCERSERRDTSR
jgi:hypothetical protein